MPQISIVQLGLSGGETIELQNGDVVIVVGPNNAGKSALLRGIRDRLERMGSATSPVVSWLKTERLGSHIEVEALLEKQAAKDPRQPTSFRFSAGSVNRGQIQIFWTPDHPLNGLAHFFCKHVGADQRLHAASSTQLIDFLHDPPTHPLHFVYREPGLEDQISRRFSEAFGLDLVLNRISGSNLHLHVGRRPIFDNGTHPWSSECREALNCLPLLEEQGDGMRSFAGLVLETLTGAETVQLVDEPEAFLHPPQARLIGRLLVEAKPQNRQLILATHSGDVLRGVLDADLACVRVVRLTRDGSANHVVELKSEEINRFWSDPLLRYSNILDGLFHELVVVCEADSDARFYAAIADALFEEGALGPRRPDAMFVHCGGKHRLPLVVQSLRGLGVCVRTIVDFDVLREECPLRGIFEAAGGDWSEIDSVWRCINSSITNRKAEKSILEVKAEVDNIFSGLTGSSFPNSARIAIQKAMKEGSQWGIAKSSGKSYVPNGGPAAAFDYLQDSLRKVGVHIVEVGELENFVRSIGDHGPAWVNEALKRDLGTDPELRGAREFIEGVLSL